MADKDIKQRIVLEGEKEYSNALKEAQRNLKVLRSELKAESAELGKNATEQQKNEAKVKNLAKQIKEQEKIVRTYEKALQEVREKYGDNEEAIAKWEIKLNDARTALANMKNGLDNVGSGLKQTNADLNTGVTAANSLADSFSKISNIGTSVSTALEGVFTSMVSTIGDTVSAIWTQLTEIAAEADKYSDIAAFLGSTPAEVQKWSNAMKSAGGNLDTVVSLMTRLKYGGKDKKVTEWFGISAENYENDLLYFEAVMSKMAESKDAMKAAGTWTQAMSDIFGAKKVQDVDGILSDWNEISAGLAKYDVEQGGFGLTDEQIEKMNTFYNTVNNLKTSWETLKDMAYVELFGDLALNITGNLQNIVDAFKDYFSAEDDAGRQAALDKIKANIIEIFEQVKEAINQGIQLLNELAQELKNSDDSTLQILGNLLESITKGLEWFTNPENWETVKKGFEAIIGVWATGKILGALGNMATFGAHLATIGRFFGWGGGGSAALSGGSAAATGTSAAATGGGFWSNALGLVKNAGNVGVFAAPLLLFADALKHDFDLLNSMTAQGSAEQARYEELSGLYSGGGMFDIWDTLTKYVKLPDRQNNGMEEFAEHYVEWLDDQVSDPMLDQLADLMDQDTWEAFGESMRSIMNGDIMYSDEERAAFIDPIRQVLDLIEQDLNGGGFGNGELPADWWTNQNNLTSDDLSSFRTLPNNISAAVRNGVSSIRVTMDGQTVGRLVAPYVSEQIARDMV